MTAILAPENVEFVSAGDQLLQFAVYAALYHYDAPLVSGELTRLVPHLHPTDAAMRFGALRESCEAWLKVTARANGDDPLIADAARSSLDHFEGLVDHALGQMFTPTIAFEDDGSMWTAPVVETAVAA